jgi:uncharacterized protein (DUF2062 family)
MVTGLLVLSAAVGTAAYFLTVLIWRWWIGVRWRRRHRREVPY